MHVPRRSFLSSSRRYSAFFFAHPLALERWLNTPKIIQMKYRLFYFYTVLIRSLPHNLYVYSERIFASFLIESTIELNTLCKFNGAVSTKANKHHRVINKFWNIYAVLYYRLLIFIIFMYLKLRPLRQFRNT